MSSSIGVVDIASRVGGVGNVSRVVGVSSGNSIGIGKSSSYLSNSVGISIRISGPLANIVSSSISNSSMMSIADRGNMVGSIGVVDIASRVGGVGNISRVVGASSGNSVGKGKSSSYLANGVSIGIR